MVVLVPLFPSLMTISFFPNVTGLATITHFYVVHVFIQLAFCIISMQISVHRSDEDHKPWITMSKSFDNLNDINREATSEKKKDGGNILSRFFKFKTLQTPLIKKAREKLRKKSSNRSSVADDETPHEGGESSLANSMSMPDIACELKYLSW